MKFIMLINTTLEFESKKNLNFKHFSFYEQLLSCSIESSMEKSFISSGPGQHFYLSLHYLQLYYHKNVEYELREISGLQIYGGPGSLSHDFKIWHITF